MLSIKEQIIQALDHLSEDEQQKILAFIQRNILPPGIPGKEMVALVHELNFDSEDLALMAQAIEEECERIDWGEW